VSDNEIHKNNVNSENRKDLMKKRNFSRDEHTKSKQIEVEEDVVYFQYNSDGDANIQIDEKSDANLS
jgi:hypothetical protein